MPRKKKDEQLGMLESIPAVRKNGRTSKSAAKSQTTAQRLASVVKSARAIMRKDKGLNGDLDRLPMLTWIMFLKFLDDMEKIREEEAALAGPKAKYRPAIEAPYRWRDWAADTDGITGDPLIAFINNDEAERPDGTRGPGLFAYLRRLEGHDGRDRRDVIATVFRGVTNRMINGYLLRDVINKIDGIHFDSTEEIHTLGTLYESMLKEMRDAAGDSGEFYTPRAVVKFIVEVMDPRIGETVLDPACGTGGFLVEAYRHMESQANTVEDHDRLQRSTIKGGEAKPLPYLLAQMNLVLHGLEAPEIDPGNSLRYNLNEIGDADRVDVILTNPPFGGEEEPGIQGNFPADKRTSETALLFLQLIMRRLRRAEGAKSLGGRAAVVVPNGTLSDGGIAARVKHQLLLDFNLHTIVRLPGGTFLPYTPIPTNILFFDRSGPTRNVWYYEHPLPSGLKKYSKTRPITFDEFQPELEWWESRVEGVSTWSVNVEELIKYDEAGSVVSVDLDRRNPSRRSAQDHEPVDALVSRAIAAGSAASVQLQRLKHGIEALTSSTDNQTTWPDRALGELMKAASDQVTVDVSASYPNLGLYSYARGVFRKPPIQGIKTSATALNRVKAGQFIYSRLFAFEGAYAIVPSECDGYFVSNEYPVFDIDHSLLDPHFLIAYFQSPDVWREVAVGSKGLGDRRQRVQPSQILAHRLPLPPLDVQREIAALHELSINLSQLAKEIDESSSRILGSVIWQLLLAGTSEV